jgi:hypothetical protein
MYRPKTIVFGFADGEYKGLLFSLPQKDIVADGFKVTAGSSRDICFLSWSI